MKTTREDSNNMFQTGMPISDSRIKNDQRSKPLASVASPSETSIAYMNKMGVLFHADCMDVLPTVRDNSIDLIFTDPPFNLGKDYDTGAYEDSMNEESYKKWCSSWMDELVRVLRPGGSLAIYSWPRWVIEVGSHLHTIPALEYRSLISLRMKSGFPLKGRLHPSNYCIMYYVKKGAKAVFNVVRYRTPICRHCGKEIRDYGGYRNKFEKYEDADGIPWIQISDFWEDTRPARQDKSRRLKVNELPIHIPERVVLMASNENDVILDIFGGGGSTFHAAQMHNRFWIGCEIGNISPCLSRFATIWGKTEENKPPGRIYDCFKSRYFDRLLAKRASGDPPMKDIELLNNGKAIKKDMLSKSKVIGF